MDDKNMSDAERAIMIKRAALDAKEIENKIGEFYEAYKDTKYVQFSFEAFVFCGVDFVVTRRSRSLSGPMGMVIDALKKSQEGDDEKS